MSQICVDIFHAGGLMTARLIAVVLLALRKQMRYRDTTTSILQGTEEEVLSTLVRMQAA
jgi:hypothetical protein